MRSVMLGLLAETYVHVGSGRSVGVIDLPFAREAATGYPVIPGSGMKGALRDRARASDSHLDADTLFGKQDSAGELLVSDARMLLHPVRSLHSAYKWVTCPHLLERFGRDSRRAGFDAGVPGPSVDRGKWLGAGSGTLVLEDRAFEHAGELPGTLIPGITRLVRHPETAARLKDQVVVIHDDDYGWFANFGLAVHARNVLEEDTKRSKNLWYEESLSPDTVMYALVSARNGTPSGAVPDLFPDSDPYLQAGGNETVGQGWFAVTVCAAPDDEEES